MAELRRAQRKRTKLKLGISAASGSGKTISSLIFAYGLVKGEHPDWTDEQIWDKIGVIDSENGSSELYTEYTVKDTGFHIGTFWTIPISAPFTPEKYIDAIETLEKEGFEVCIIDSMTHLWNGQGALLERQGNVAKRTGNSYTAWREITPIFNRFVDTMLQCNMHVIATIRAKVEYVQEKDSKGHTTIRKVGMAPVFRDGIEYEFSMFMDIDSDHQAHVTKDRTGILDDEYFVINGKEAEKVAKWLSTGAEMKPNEPPAQPVKAEPKTEVEKPTTGSESELTETIEQIDNLARVLGDAGVPKAAIADAIKSQFKVNGRASANYNAIKDVATAQAVLAELEKLMSNN